MERQRPEKCILRITNPTEGHICYKGKDISRASKEEIKSIRREIQLIFQDPYGSLDPRQSAYSIIKEAVVTGKEKYTESEVAARVKGIIGDRRTFAGNGRPVSS